jgi:hypothetical protein
LANDSNVGAWTDACWSVTGERHLIIAFFEDGHFTLGFHLSEKFHLRAVEFAV